MAIQKYRADFACEKYPNGSIPWYTRWVGGPTLALIENCPIQNLPIDPRKVYIKGNPDTFFSIPAACRYRGKTIHGYANAKDVEMVKKFEEIYEYLDKNKVK